MASGDPLDIQREKRWPDHTKPAAMPGIAGTNEVMLKPYEEDSEYSDTEGILGGGAYYSKTGWLKGHGPGTEGDEENGEEIAVKEDAAPKEADD
jgi:hypothetical protein